MMFVTHNPKDTMEKKFNPKKHEAHRRKQTTYTTVGSKESYKHENRVRHTMAMLERLS